LLGPLHELLAHNFVVKALVQVPLLRMLNTNELDAIVEELQESMYTKGESIIKQGEKGDIFYIIKSGSCKVPCFVLLFTHNVIHTQCYSYTG
jgi:hypothetical protein